ncbi:MAG: DUF2946 family protein [Glaciimonas sp.]|nr:DUF2946 family protein [Glaciimonas sp.]
MDDIVKQAMTKWPNVPACFGWLALDARGAWRMRDEAAQRNNLPGDKIMHTALVGFINRNYSHDEQGRWYFQNGPQRVYVDVALTPYIAHTDPVLGLVLQTGEVLNAITAIMLTTDGQPILIAGEKCAALDDRDIAEWMHMLRMDGVAISDEDLMHWLENPSHASALTWHGKQQSLTVQSITTDDFATRFGFVAQPRFA